MHMESDQRIALFHYISGFASLKSRLTVFTHNVMSTVFNCKNVNGHAIVHKDLKTGGHCITFVVVIQSIKLQSVPFDECK